MSPTKKTPRGSASVRGKKTNPVPHGSTGRAQTPVSSRSKLPSPEEAKRIVEAALTQDIEEAPIPSSYLEESIDDFQDAVARAASMALDEDSEDRISPDEGPHKSVDKGKRVATSSDLEVPEDITPQDVDEALAAIDTQERLGEGETSQAEVPSEVISVAGDVAAHSDRLATIETALSKLLMEFQEIKSDVSQAKGAANDAATLASQMSRELDRRSGVEAAIKSMQAPTVPLLTSQGMDTSRSIDVDVAALRGGPLKRPAASAEGGQAKRKIPYREM